MKVKVKSLSHVRLLATLWTVAYEVPPSIGFSRQEYWSGLLFPSPGDLPNPGIEPRSLALLLLLLSRFLILGRPLLLLLPIPPSIRVFSNKFLNIMKAHSE